MVCPVDFSFPGLGGVFFTAAGFAGFATGFVGAAIGCFGVAAGFPIVTSLDASGITSGLVDFHSGAASATVPNGSPWSGANLNGRFCPIYGTLKGSGTLAGPYRFTGDDNSWEVTDAAASKDALTRGNQHRR